MFKLVVIFLLPLSLFAQQLVYEFAFDTVKYERVDVGWVIQSPYIPHGGNYEVGTANWVLRIKNSDHYDIFSFNGIIGSVTVPNSIMTNGYLSSIVFSQTIIDNDAGWEYIVCYYDSVNKVNLFKVIDDNGTKLLSDTGTRVNYGYDGQNTYVYTSNGTYPIKVWKFRSNAGVSNPPSLSKSSVSSIGPIMSLMPSGDLRLTLQPDGGRTSIQIFDILGRQLFKKTIQSINNPESFLISSSDVPKCPFVAKINNTNMSITKKEIPVR